LGQHECSFRLPSWNEKNRDQDIRVKDRLH
jgi:hypothetical protein